MPNPAAGIRSACIEGLSGRGLLFFEELDCLFKREHAGETSEARVHEAPMAPTNDSVRSRSQFSSKPVISPAVKASPAPDSSTVSIGKGGVAITWWRHVAKVPQGPRVITTAQSGFSVLRRCAGDRTSLHPVKRAASSSLGRK